MQRKLSCLFILALVGVLPSCVTQFDEALVNPATAVQDADLFGTWMSKDANGNTQVLLVGAEPEHPLDTAREAVEPGLCKFSLVGIGPDHKLSDPITMRFVATKIGKDHYASAVIPEKSEKIAFWVYKYRVDGDTLHVWHGDGDAWAKVVESGSLRGHVNREANKIKTIKVTDTAANVSKFLENGGDTLVFPESGHVQYTRAK